MSRTLPTAICSACRYAASQNQAPALSSARRDACASLLGRDGAHHRGERLALLDDVRRDHDGLALGCVLPRVHLRRGHEEAVAGLELLGWLAIDLQRELALEDKAHLFAGM